jgi:ribonuclease P protein component
MTGQIGGSVGASARKASSTIFGRLKQRSEFLAAAKGTRLHEAAFSLQARTRTDETDTRGRRFGLTVTKKTGNSVERNRIRRRLREALRENMRGSLIESPACDYVIVARRECLSIGFADLTQTLGKTLARIDQRLARKPKIPTAD